MKMWKILILSAVLAFGMASSASAQITVPNTFTTRQVISSSKMNQNFDEVELKALNRTAPILQATLDLDVTATYDLGTSTHKFRDGWFSRNVSVGGTLTVTGATTLAALSATSGAFSTTLNVTGATTIAALTATSGNFSGTVTAAAYSGPGTGLSNVALLNASNVFSAANPIVLGNANNGTIRTDLAGYLTMQSGSTGFAWRNQANNATILSLDNGGNNVIMTPSTGHVGGFIHHYEQRRQHILRCRQQCRRHLRGRGLHRHALLDGHERVADNHARQLTNQAVYEHRVEMGSERCGGPHLWHLLSPCTLKRDALHYRLYRGWRRNV
jgi:hypothetical protein